MQNQNKVFAYWGYFSICIAQTSRPATRGKTPFAAASDASIHDELNSLAHTDTGNINGRWMTNEIMLPGFFFSLCMYYTRVFDHKTSQTKKRNFTPTKRYASLHGSTAVFHKIYGWRTLEQAYPVRQPKYEETRQPCSCLWLITGHFFFLPMCSSHIYIYIYIYKGRFIHQYEMANGTQLIWLHDQFPFAALG